MKPWERRIAPLGFALAGVVFLIAGLLGAFRGGHLNVAFLSVGVLCLVFGIGLWRKVSQDPGQSG